MSKRKAERILSVLLLFCVACLMGCSSSGEWTQEQEETEVYAFVTKSEGNPYFELMAEGFSEVVEQEGGNCIISNPDDTTAEAQIEAINELISQNVDGIAVAANDADALSEVLEEASEQGIHITTVDSDVNIEDREIFVNQAASEEIAEVLVEAVYDLCGGSGQWAILSASSQATNQNTWIYAMKEVLEEEKYQDLRLVDIVYGNDETELSAELTEELLVTYPDLKVICAPTVVGLAAVAQVLSEQEDTQVKATGLGLPSDMADYVLSEDSVCPYLFLWNPIDLGQMSAYVLIALTNGEINGEAGESFQAGDMGSFLVEESENGGLEVIVDGPIRFDDTNINEWKELF